MKRCNRAVFLSNLNLLVCDLLEDLTIEFFNSNYLDVLFYILCKLKKRNVCLLNLLSLRNFSKSVKPNLEETYESMLKTIGHTNLNDCDAISKTERAIIRDQTFLASIKLEQENPKNHNMSIPRQENNSAKTRG